MTEPVQPDAVRCADCHAPYRLRVDMLTERQMWFAPKPTRKCRHPVTRSDYLIDGEWTPVEVKL